MSEINRLLILIELKGEIMTENIRNMIAEAVVDMTRQENEFILEKLKELLRSGAIWVEHTAPEVSPVDDYTLDFLKSRGKSSIPVHFKKSLRFCFDGLDTIERLQEENERLRSELTAEEIGEIENDL